MKKKQLRKVLDRLDAIEGRLDQITAQEKRVVDLVVGLTTEHVGRMLRELTQGLDEKKIVDTISRSVTGDVERMIDRKKLDVEHLADHVAKRIGEDLARRLGDQGS